MKTYDEMAKSVFERKDEYEKNQKIKRKKITALTASLACVALAFVVGGGMLKNYISPKPEQQAEDAVYPGIKDWYGPGEDEPTLSGEKDGGEKSHVSQKTETFSEEKTEIYEEKSAANSGNNVGEINGFFRPTGKDNQVFNPTEGQQRVLVESYTYDGDTISSEAYSYKSPDNGEYFFSYLLNKALEKHGDAAIYRVRVDVFKENKLITDNAELEKTADILAEKGCTVALEYTNGECVLTLHATESQLKSFEADGEHGYFLFLFNDMR